MLNAKEKLIKTLKTPISKTPKMPNQKPDIMNVFHPRAVAAAANCPAESVM
jgi:hypothetical protein